MDVPSARGPLVVVFNRGSGHGDADEARAAIDRACAHAGRAVQVLLVQDPRHVADLAREAVRRARQSGGVVVAAGGDGTLNAVAQATLGSGCAFGVLPRGTFNYFSRTHGIPADLEAALAVLLHEAPQPVHVGRVNGQLFLVNASLGLYPQLLEDREAWKQRFGRSRLVALGAGVATLLQGFRSLRLHVEVQGQARDVRTPTLFVGNNALQMEQVGLPHAPAIDAGELAGLMLRPVTRWALLGLMLRGALGSLGDADQVSHFAFRRLTVSRARGVGARRLKVATDGEIRWMTLPLLFEVASEPLWLIRPPGPAPERLPLAAGAATATAPAPASTTTAAPSPSAGHPA
jgi:diacylglycerol kinase family enzyme